MSFDSLLCETASIYRKQDYLLYGDIAETVVQSTPSSGEVIINAELSAMTAGGTITITGNLDSVSHEENLYFTSIGVKVGSTLFSYIDTVSFSVGMSGTVKVFATSPSGEEVNSESVVYSSMPIRLYKIDKEESLQNVGSIISETLRCMYSSTYSLNNEDVLYINSDRYVIKNIQPIYGASSIHHYEGILEGVDR